MSLEATAQSPDVVVCRDDNRPPSTISVEQIADCYSRLLAYANAQGYLDPLPGWIPRTIPLGSGTIRIDGVKVCQGGGTIGGGGMIGGGGVVVNCSCADDVPRSPARHFAGFIYRVAKFRTSATGTALLGREVRLTRAVEQIEVPKRCPVAGSEADVRSILGRIVSTGTHSCSQWPDDTGVGNPVMCFAPTVIRGRGVVLRDFQGEDLVFLRELLRAEN
ncbi:MAG: hypothetical protein AAGO57_05885 [Pseudomonadota bacterium]